MKLESIKQYLEERIDYYTTRLNLLLKDKAIAHSERKDKGQFDEGIEISKTYIDAYKNVFERMPI